MFENEYTSTGGAVVESFASYVSDAVSILGQCIFIKFFFFLKKVHLLVVMGEATLGKNFFFLFLNNLWKKKIYTFVVVMG
jgi:hypothetical protein